MARLILLISALTLVAASQTVQGFMPRELAMRLCRERTGLKEGDIRQYHTRNQFCALDCETRQGTLMTAYADDQYPCNDQDGYRCILGACRGQDSKLDDEIRSLDLNTVTLGIKSAFVADRDPYPGQGESDAFVVVEIASEGKPSYNGSEVVCHTHVIQDSSRPKWNFVCKPLPLKSSAQLRFVVMDSDKPDTQPQLLGQTTQTLSTLMNVGPQTLILEHPKLGNGPYWLEVEIKASRYSPSD